MSNDAPAIDLLRHKQFWFEHSFTDAQVLAPDFLDSVARPIVLDGRLADPDATDEIVINEAMAEASGYGPGDRVTLEMSPYDLTKGRIVYRL